MRIINQIQDNMAQDTKETIWTLFIDLKSAFDKVDHKILMQKLRKLNINENNTVVS